MKILAVDPAPEESAWVMWDTETHDFYGARMGLDLVGDIVLWPFLGPRVDICAIEFPQSYGVNAGLSLFLTAFEAGRVARSLEISTEIRLYGRPAVKGQIGGKNDSEIRKSLMMRHGEAKKGQKLYGVKKDIWAALALAVAIDENPNLRYICPR